jgi:hypothetical protein
LLLGLVVEMDSLCCFKFRSVVGIIGVQFHGTAVSLKGFGVVATIHVLIAEANLTRGLAFFRDLGDFGARNGDVTGCGAEGHLVLGGYVPQNQTFLLGASLHFDDVCGGSRGDDNEACEKRGELKCLHS